MMRREGGREVGRECKEACLRSNVIRVSGRDEKWGSK